MEERVRILEREKERKDRIERRNNIVVRGYKGKDGDAKKGVEEVLKQIGTNVKVEEVRVVKTGKEERGGMAVVRLREGDKREVMEKKKRLKGESI